MKLTLYHRTERKNIGSILLNGILRGSITRIGEKLPFVLATRTKQEPLVGGTAHLRFEIDDDEKGVISVNRDWVEIHRDIKTGELTGIAIPPETTAEVIDLYTRCNKNTNHPEFKAAFEYVDLNIKEK